MRRARAAFRKGNVYMQMRDVLGSIHTDAQFADLFASRGRPAEAPWRLAFVTVMQFAEGLSDRQAAEAVRARIDWKYALGLPVLLVPVYGILLAVSFYTAGPPALIPARRTTQSSGVHGETAQDVRPFVEARYACAARMPDGDRTVTRRRQNRDQTATEP